MSLTSNVLQEIVCCQDPERFPRNPVLQILGVKKLAASGSSSSDRYRLVVSDGVHYYTSAMLGTQLNHMIEEKSIDVKTVIQMNHYTCNVIQQTRKIIIILELAILQKAADVPGKIGNPEQLTDLLEKQNELKPIKKESNNNDMNRNGAAQNNRIAHKPSPAKQPSPYSSGPTQTSTKNVFPIASLTPYQNRWTIRARITNKSAIRTWSNSRGEGKLFSMDLVDESGEIRATGFNDIVDKYYNMVEAGKVYYITKGTLKTANKQYSNLRNDYEMTLNSDSLIELCTEECNLPQLQFHFRQIRDIEQVNKDALIDIIGVVKSSSDVTQITTKATNKQLQSQQQQQVSLDADNSSFSGAITDQVEENFEEEELLSLIRSSTSSQSQSLLYSDSFKNRTSQEVNQDLDKLLIIKVQAHPIIWNTHLAEYKHHEKKEIVWNGIAAKLGKSVDQAKNRWKNLSESYKKCQDRRRQQCKSGSGYTKAPTCHFFQELSFLKDIVANPTTHTNVLSPGQSFNLSTQPVLMSPPPSSPAIPAPVSTPDTRVPVAITVPSKRKKEAETSDPLEDFLLQEIKASGNSDTTPVKDEEDLFCASIAPTLRRLPLQKKQLAKLKIQQLLFEIEFDE